MVLTIEDGTGVTGADSFITLVEFNAIHAEYLAHAEIGSGAAQEAALRRAFKYLCSLDWKAEFTFPTFGGTIPDDIKVANAILGHFENAEPFALAPSVKLGQLKVLNRVGEIGWKVTGSAGVDAQRLTVQFVADILKPYLATAGDTVFLQRA